MIFIVGGKGLVGSSLVRQLAQKNEAYKIIQRENKEEFFGEKCRILIYANGNAYKTKANENPLFDWNASVSTVAEYVHHIRYELFVLISTVDVYDGKGSEETTVEDIAIQPNDLDSYGYHKFLAENYVRHYCQNHLIFRLPGLVGEGLKKNPAYDYVHPDKKVMISPDSQLNFIHTRIVATSLFKILGLGLQNETFNLASKNSIRIGDIGKITSAESEFTPDAIHCLQTYQINTKKIQKVTNLPTSEECIKEYIDENSRHRS